MSNISYKTLWQEVRQENEQLKTELAQLKEELAQLRQQYRRETDKVFAYIQSNRNELARTRPIVDLAGIARHMRVARFTPQQWAQRGLLPPVDFPEIKEPLWYAATIREQFVIPTERIWYDTARDDDEGLSAAA